LLATAGDDGAIQIWDLATGGLARTLGGHQAPVLELRTDGAGRRLLSAGQDGTVRVWDPATGAEEHSFPSGGRGWGGDISGDGERVVVARGDLGAELWQLDGRRRLAVLRAPRQ